MIRRLCLALLLLAAGCRFAPLPPFAKLPPGYHPIRPAGRERIASPQELEEAFARRRDELIGVLKSGSEENRSYAREELGRMGRAALEALRTLAKDEDAEARVEAARALGATREPDALVTLAALLSEDDWSVREAAADGIGRLGKRPEGDVLLARLKDDAWRVRLAAIRALGQVGETRAAEPLAPLTSDVDEDVRYEAYLALARLGQPSSRATLAKGLDVEDPNVRKACVEGLARAGDASDIAVLEGHLRESSSDVQIAVILAITTLAKGTPPQSVRPVVEGWIDVLGSQDPTTHWRAIGLLYRLGKAATPFILDRVPTSSPAQQVALIDLLQADPEPGILAPLASLYPKVEAEARRAILSVASRLKVPEAVAVLKLAAVDDTSELRSVALTELAHRGGADAESAIADGLQDKEASVRRQAASLAMALAEGPRFAAAMKTIAGEADPQVRRALLSLVAGVHQKEARDALVAEFHSSKDVETRRQVVRDLGALRLAELRPFLLEALACEDAQVRIAAVNGLLTEGSPESAPAVEDLLSKEKDSGVQAAALFTLASLAPSRALDRLRAALTSGEPTLREMALAALSQVQTAESAHLLEEVARKQDDPLRQKAFEALARMPANLAAPVLVGIVQEEGDEYLRSLGARTLAMWNYQGAAPALRACLANEQSPIVRPALIESLGLLRDADSVAPIAEAAKDPDVRVRTGALLSLGLVGTEAAVPPLVDALKDSDTSIRKQAIEALGFLHPPAAEGALVECLADPAAEVRRAAVFAVAAYHDPARTSLVIETMRTVHSELTGASLRLKCAEELYGGGFSDVAAEEFENVLRLSPDGSDCGSSAQTSLADIEASKSDFSAAADHTRAAIMLLPDGANPKLRQSLDVVFSILHGVALLTQGREASGIREIDAGLARSDHDAEWFNTAAFYLAEAGLQLDRAKAYMDEALRKKPDDANLLDTAGWLAYRRGELKSAKEYLSQAVSKGTTNGEVYYHLACVESFRGEREDAVAHLCKALDMAPHLGGKIPGDARLGDLRQDPRVRRALSPAAPR